jgi:hypothetical protein
MAFNEEQLARPIINQLSDMIANFVRHPNNDEIKENFEIASKEGVQLSIKKGLVSTTIDMGQLSRL